MKSKRYARFFYITGFQIRQPFQIRNKTIRFLHWIFIKTHLFFLFRCLEFTLHLTKVFSWVGWSCRSSMFSGQNTILNRKHKVSTPLSFTGTYWSVSSFVKYSFDITHAMCFLKIRFSVCSYFHNVGKGKQWKPSWGSAPEGGQFWKNWSPRGRPPLSSFITARHRFEGNWHSFHDTAQTPGQTLAVPSTVPLSRASLPAFLLWTSSNLLKPFLKVPGQEATVTSLCVAQSWKPCPFHIVVQTLSCQRGHRNCFWSLVETSG